VVINWIEVNVSGILWMEVSYYDYSTVPNAREEGNGNAFRLRRYLYAYSHASIITPAIKDLDHHGRTVHYPKAQQHHILTRQSLHYMEPKTVE